MQTKTYRVKNVWRTLQGEGFHLGRPAVFARFVGCNMWSGYEADRARDAARNAASCPKWCDTSFTKEGSADLPAAALARRMAAVGDDVRFCVLTGGEPLLQANAALMRALQAEGFTVAVETNGTVALEEAFGADETHWPDWITCSPKLPEERLALECFDELKLVVPDYHPADYARFGERARSHRVGGEQVPLRWLQPEDGPRFGEAKRRAAEWALAHPGWRAGVQAHKVWEVE